MYDIVISLGLVYKDKQITHLIIFFYWSSRPKVFCKKKCS